MVWAGAALLGWVAGELINDEPFVANILYGLPGLVMHFLLPVVGAVFVVATGWLLRRRHAAHSPDPA